MMKESFIPYGAYIDIINLLGQWKILDMKSLYEMCNYKLKYFNLLKKVRKLEKEGLVKGILLGRKNKHIFLTNEGIQYTNYDDTYEIHDENITHDMVVNRVLKELLNLENFYSGKMFHQIMDDKLLPDAQVEGIRNGEKYRLAIEVELTQKSDSRVKEKYRRYAQGEFFNYALFLTNKASLFKAYKRFLKEMKNEIHPAIILLFDKNLSPTKFCYESSDCFYLNKKIDFKQLFGAERS